MRDYVIDLVQRYVDSRIRKSGDENITCRCPFHKGGQETKPSFSVNVERGLFHCFTCHASGGLPKLLSMLGLPPHEVDKELGPIRGQIKNRLQHLRIRTQKEDTRWVRPVTLNDNFYKAPQILSESIISAFNWCPAQLIDMGFHQQWLQYLQIGVDRQNQRITYPVRDIYGNLAGFVGGRTNAGQLPKYKVYKGKSIVDGVVIPGDYGTWFDEEYPGYEFKNHEYLWNFDKVYPSMYFGKEVETLIIVEGFKACIWLLQHGWRNVVALMGDGISERQLELLLRVRANYLLFLDNNEAGQEATQKIGNVLQKAVPMVWAVQYPPEADDECQPDDLDYSHLYQVIGNAPLFRDWKKQRKQRWV
jgi:DNA primase